MNILSIVFGLTAAVVWGTGDFCGGLATRRANVLSVMVLSQGLGLILLTLLALITREHAPSGADIAWGGAAGLAGLVGIGALYTGMARGQMGVVAPVSGVISAALPVVAGAVIQGLPNLLNVLGFVLALAGVWLISRTEHARAQPASVLLALLSGLGFGCFIILIAQAEHGTVFWPLAVARVVSLLVLLGITVARRSFQPPPQNALLPITVAGVADSGGNLFFLLAAQAGRLDVSGALASLYPAATVLLALLLLRERLGRGQVRGMLLALIAIPLISMP
jgi:drug/metabolite transporter (DMT)-like permease